MASDLIVLIGMKIREVRERKKLSIQKLSELSEISEKHLGEIERGKGNPSIRVLEKITEALGIQVKDLFKSDHLQPRHRLINELQESLDGLNEAELRKIYSLLKAIL